MCAIMGALIWRVSVAHLAEDNRVLKHIGNCSFDRGRDGWGYYVRENPSDDPGEGFERKSLRKSGSLGREIFFDLNRSLESATVIGNFRAEPTTEYVARKREADQQPYRLEGWNIVHNGTIANDKELRTNQGYPTKIDSAAIVEQLAAAGEIPDKTYAKYVFQVVISRLKGSYAILATHDNFPDLVFAACNYRPIWFAKQDNAVFFASSHQYFPGEFVPEMLPAYSCWAFEPDQIYRLDEPIDRGTKALVICSGGMDSVVAATMVKQEGYQVELLHFQYGSRAENPEEAAIKAVAEYLEVPLHLIPMKIYDPKDSPLLRSDSTIAGGEEGAEFAHEWVPARNLVMLAIATAFAEARGFGTIVLGNNLEEAGAYPDNEPEFINRFNEVLPFAVGDGKKVRVIMPVGNLMKHEIVALGHKLGAPLQFTWSCYRAGMLHCGTCGPCFMRKTAFAINNLPEVIQYASNE